MAEVIIFDAQGFKDLADRMQQGPTRLKISLNDGLRRIGSLFVPAKGTGPLADATPKRTGRGARSTFYQITGAIAEQVLTIFQPAHTDEGYFYLEGVREGTRPHEIVANKAKALRWINDAGDVVFRFRVHHPGNAPNPYHRRVFAALSGRIQAIVDDMGARVVSYLSGRGG